MFSAGSRALLVCGCCSAFLAGLVWDPHSASLPPLCLAQTYIGVNITGICLNVDFGHGMNHKATYQPTTSTISSSTPKIDSKRNLSKSGTLSFCWVWAILQPRAGSGSSSGASSWLSSCNVSMPSALGGGVVIGPARSPTGHSRLALALGLNPS